MTTAPRPLHFTPYHCTNNECSGKGTYAPNHCTRGGPFRGPLRECGGEVDQCTALKLKIRK